MDQIIAKLSAADEAEIIQHIVAHYQRHRYTCVNFLYFANAMTYRLFETNSQSADHKAQLHAGKYKTSLLASDFLLPDGIALQLWSKWTEKKSLHNLNGTDLTPLMLDYLNKHAKASLYVYSLYDPKIGKGEEWLMKALSHIQADYPNIRIAHSYQSLYSNRGADFPFDEIKKISEADNAEVKLFLNCTGTPFQEMRTQEYKDFFQKCSFLVMNVGGFIDFVAGFEKRAPRWVVKARVLETFWRVVSNPRKNLKKFLAMFGIFRIISGRLRLKKEHS